MPTLNFGINAFNVLSILVNLQYGKMVLIFTVLLSTHSNSVDTGYPVIPMNLALPVLTISSTVGNVSVKTTSDEGANSIS